MYSFSPTQPKSPPKELLILTLAQQETSFLTQPSWSNSASRQCYVINNEVSICMYVFCLFVFLPERFVHCARKILFSYKITSILVFSKKKKSNQKLCCNCNKHTELLVSHQEAYSNNFAGIPRPSLSWQSFIRLQASKAQAWKKDIG